MCVKTDTKKKGGVLDQERDYDGRPNSSYPNRIPTDPLGVKFQLFYSVSKDQACTF